ncbi:MAG: 3-mercaptopyruvate sulfurtransferase [Pseudomonadota bacterium]
MAADDPTQLVSTDWLADRLNAPDIRIIDASLYLPTDGRNGREIYGQTHIPGARFFDIDEISDDTSPLPHMLPPVEKFVSRVRKMGIGDGHTVVVYDQQGIYSAARAWWTFRLFGHQDVAVLDGGLPKWMAEGRPVEDEPVDPRERHFTGRRNGAMVRDVTQMARAVKLGDEQIVDARAAERFRGEVEEPRKGLRAGHIPGSMSVPFKSLLTDDQTMRAPDEIRTIFQEAGVDLSQPIVTTCGSGVTAAVLTLALARIGHTRNAVYDGSWVEWGAYEDLAVETG